MSRSCLIALAAAVFLATPAFAQDAVVNGVEDSLIWSLEIEAAGGHSWIDFDHTAGAGDVDLADDEHPFFVGDIRFTVPLVDQIGLQLDGGYYYGWPEGLEDSSSGAGGGLSWYGYGGGHLAYRDPSRFALGVFGLYGRSYGGEVGGPPPPEMYGDFWLAGAEGQVYWNDFIVYLQGGYFAADQVQSNGSDATDFDVMDDAWFVRGVLRYFPDAISRVQIEGSYADGREDEPFDSSLDLYLAAASWEARYDRQLHGNFGLFVGYHGTRVEQTGPESNDQCCDDLTDHAVVGGIRVQFGATSIAELNRRGVTFSMPDVGRWTAYTSEAIDTGN